MSGENLDLVALTAEIVSAHVVANSVRTTDVAPLIDTVFTALSGLGKPMAADPESTKPQPATTARKSLATPTHILSMIDGKPYKMLRRHIAVHGYTPESYRDAFDLPGDYPMVARDYSEKRRTLAVDIGLGRKPKDEATRQEPVQAGHAEPAVAATGEATDKSRRRKLRPAFGDAVAAAKEHLRGE